MVPMIVFGRTFLGFLTMMPSLRCRSSLTYPRRGVPRRASPARGPDVVARTASGQQRTLVGGPEQ